MLVTFTKGWENDHAVVFPNTVVSAEYLKIAKPIRMAKTKKKTWTQLTIPSAGDHMEQLELNYALMGGSPSTTPQKTVWYCLLKMMACIVCMCVCVCVWVFMLNYVQLFVTPWTVTCQAPLSMEFSRQEYLSALPFPFPGDLPDSGILCLLHWQADSLPLRHLGT